MSDPAHPGDIMPAWPEGGVSRVPYRLFSDTQVYALEQERLFRGPVWNYLCLELEVAEPGDFRTAFIGETPIVVARDETGALRGMVNRCAHKGALVCLAERGNRKHFSCIYHSWTYHLDGRLRGVAFRGGLKGKGGMPEDFDPARHRMQPIRVETFCGLVFGTFEPDMPPVEEWVGPTMAHFLKRNLGARPLKVLGTHSQIIHNNWKLYAENVRDSYHATLLHTFYTTFKVNRLDMDGGILLSEGTPWHHISYAKRATLEEAAEYKEAKVHSASYDSKLNGPALLETEDEFDDGITHSVQSIFPTLAVHFTLNSLCVRNFVPRGLEETELVWTYLGYADDSEEMTAMRVLQANLTGAAGLVSLEDGCINEFVQRGTRGSGDAAAVLEMGGRGLESSESSRATEVSIRGFWSGYRGLMGYA